MEFIVYIDHLSLQYFKTIKNPFSRITKNILKLMEYDFIIKHKADSENLAAFFPIIYLSICTNYLYIYFIYLNVNKINN